MSDQRPAGEVAKRAISLASIGASLAMLAAACYAIVNALLRSVAADVDPFAGSLIRQVPLILITTTALLVLRPQPVRPKSIEFIGAKMIVVLMVAGSISFLVGNVLLFSGLNFVGLAVATAASQGGMVIGGALVSATFLKEPPTRWQIVGMLIVLVGLVFVASPSFSSVQINGMAAVGFLLSLGAGICYTIASAASRTVQRRPHTFITALALTNIGGVLALIIAVGVRSGWRFDLAYQELTGEQVLIILLAGLVNAVAIGSITLAVRFTTVTVVSALGSLVIVFGVIIAWTVFHEEIAAAVFIGAAVIILGVLTTLKKARSSGPKATEPGGAGQVIPGTPSATAAKEPIEFTTSAKA